MMKIKGMKKGLGLVCAVVMLLFAFGASADASLISWWKFDRTSGTTADDSRGSNDGTLLPVADPLADPPVGPPTWTTNTAGGTSLGALSFDGSDDYVDVGTVSSFSFIQNTAIFTTEAWIKLDDYTESGYQTIMGNTATKADKGFFLSFEGTHDRIRAVGYRAGLKTFDGYSATNAIADNDWHHIAVAGDGTNVRIYIDDTQSGSDISVGALSWGDSTRLLNIGRYNGAIPGAYLNGTMDDVRIWDNTLTLEQIQWNWGHPGEVPSPATFILLISGLLGMVGLRKKSGF